MSEDWIQMHTCSSVILDNQMNSLLDKVNSVGGEVGPGGPVGWGDGGRGAEEEEGGRKREAGRRYNDMMSLGCEMTSMALMMMVCRVGTPSADSSYPVCACVCVCVCVCVCPPFSTGQIELTHSKEWQIQPDRGPGQFYRPPPPHHLFLLSTSSDYGWWASMSGGGGVRGGPACVRGWH